MTRLTESWLGNPGAQSRCTNGSGQHRVGIHCTRPDGTGYDKTGSWANTGGSSWSDAESENRVSTAYCDNSADLHVLNYKWVETKG